MEFGAVLRRMRRVADISQEEMAEELHISRSNISRLESNKIELKAVDLINWCKITRNPEIMMAFIYGTDVVTGAQSAMQLITGTITFLGGIL